MRALVILIAAMALSLFLRSSAAASCAPPASVAENAARAVAVVHGTVTDLSGGSVTMRVDRVLKGDVGGMIRVFVGPARGGVAATSVDYVAARGSDHVLYLIRGADGQLETNACVGSHAGEANSAEAAYFGAGTAPSAESSPESVVGPVALPDLDLSPAWAALALALAAAIAFVVIRRSRLALRR